MTTTDTPLEAQRPGVFDDVKVLDFSAIIAGAYCTRMLADLGADVLKIEARGGDLMRQVAPLRDGESTVYSALNAGKRSLALDLKQAAAVDICRRLVGEYDVVVENFSPGVMRRLGLDYAALRALNPRLVMCSISGYGQDGPGADRPAFAPIVQAMSGFDSATLASQVNTERPLNMGLPVADTTAALQAFGALSAALYYRARTGIGQHIDIAMLDSLLSTMHRDFQIAQRPLALDRRYGPVRTTDGFVIATPLTQSQFEALAECMGQPALRQDPRFASVRLRLEHYSDLMAIFEAWTEQRTSADAVAALESAHVPAAAYRDLRDVTRDPQLAHRNMLTTVVDGAGPLTVVNAPFKYSATHAAVRAHVARVGEHTEAVLRDELGFGRDALTELADNAVIFL